MPHRRLILEHIREGRLDSLSRMLHYYRFPIWVICIGIGLSILGFILALRHRLEQFGYEGGQFPHPQERLLEATGVLPWAILGLGVVLTFVLSAYILSLVTRHLAVKQQVREQTEALRQSNEELEQFAYIASHDLKAPLRAINHLTQWLSEDLDEHLTGDSAENMRLLRARVKRMEQLLNDLLDYSRLGRKLSPRGGKPISGEVFLQQIKSLTALPQGFELSAGQEFRQLHLPRMPWLQIFQNLVSNAVKHHHLPQGKITLNAQRKPHKLVLSVCDDGPGIDPVYHEKIFRMFQTLKPRDEVEGSGMGLALVSKAVKQQRGQVRVESRPGEGCCFHIEVPLSLHHSHPEPVKEAA